MKNTKFNLIVAGVLSAVWTILLMQVQVALAAGAREYENPPCYDITGKSTAVLRSGVPNSGLMDFDDAGVGKMYQACVRMDGVSVAAKPDHLEGWVWNDNLGWVSLYCDASGKNLGISCGTIPYKVSFTVSGGTSSDFASAKLSGYAWNDNAGYISFNSAFHQVKPTAQNPNRGLIKSVDLKDTSVWSDAVGWFNLTGVKLNWNATPMKKVTPVATVLGYTSICSSKDDAVVPPPVEPAVTYSAQIKETIAPVVPKSIVYNGSNAVWVAYDDGLSAAHVRKYDKITGTPMLAYLNPAIPAEILKRAGSFLLSYDGKRDQIYVGTSLNNNIFAIRDSNATEVWPAPIDAKAGRLLDIQYDKKNDVLWALSKTAMTTEDLLKIDPATGTILGTTLINLGNVSEAKLMLDTDRNEVWTMFRHSMAPTDFVKVNASTGAIVGDTINLGIYSKSFTYDSINKAVWVVGMDSKMVMISAETGEFFNGNAANSTYDTGLTSTDTIIFDAKNKALWVGTQGVTGLGETMSKINIYDKTVVKKYTVGCLSGMCAPTMFVSEDDTNSIWLMGEIYPYVTKMSRGNMLQEASVVPPVCPNDLDGGSGVTLPTNNVPFADGEDKYEFKIPFVDGTVIDNSQIEPCAVAPADNSVSMYAAPATAGKGYCAKFSLEWDDSVDVDQTTKESQDNALVKPYASNNNGAVNKPLNYGLTGTNFTYGTDKMWGAMVTSVAPTSDQNVSEGMNNEKFYFGSDLGENYDKENSNNGQNNKLKLLKLNLLFFKYGIGGEPGTCLYGDIVDPVVGDPAYKCQMKTYVKDVNLGFRPFVALDALNYVLGTQKLNYINVENVDNALKFGYNVFQKVAPAITTYNLDLKMGLEDTTGYVINLEGNNPETPKADVNITASGTGEANFRLIPNTEATSLSSYANPYLYSVVSYNAGAKGLVKYFSDKLPRIKAGLLKNPVALIQGNVYLTDYEVKSTGIESDNKLKSLGNIASNLKREQILRNVNKYLRGKSVSAGGDVTVAGLNSVPGSMTKLLEDSAKVVYYLKGADLILDCGATCTYDKKNITFIVDGGSIKVNSDLVPAAANKNAQLGLIALKDLANSSDNGGFVYVDKEVGLMQNVNVYADRLLVSYDKGKGFDASGYPMNLGADDLARQQALGNQFVLVGTISSMNGVGSASRVTPLDENGGPVNKMYPCDYNTSTQVGLCKARIADLNYLRYYGPTLEACPSGVPRDQALKVATVPDSGCDPTVVDYDIDASCLYSAAEPNCDLVSGSDSGTVKKSAYWGAKTGLKTEYPVNFFYKAISNDLGGFEKESTFNPLLQN